MKTKVSILRQFVESVDWDTPLETLKPMISRHVTEHCERLDAKAKMARTIAGLTDRVALQKYTYNALLKFEGLGVVEDIPR